MAAFILAPLMAPITLVLLGIALAVIEDGRPLAPDESFEDFLVGVGAVSVFALPVSYLALLVFGIPSFILLKRLGRLNLSWLIVVSAAQGIIVIFFLLRAMHCTPLFHEATFLPRIVSGAAMAIGVAVAFWYIGGHSPRREG